MWIVLIIALLPAEPPLSTQTCVSSQFGWRGDALGSGPILLTGRPAYETPDLVGFAHRRLPIGSFHLLTVGDRTIWAQCADRGPYGKTDATGWFNGAREPNRKGTWRGCADLLPATGKALGHTGWAQLTIHVIPGQEDIRITRRKARRRNNG